MIPESIIKKTTSKRESPNSPSKPDSYSLNGRKERRQPSVTPRKFTRFFTPRSHGSLMSRSSRRALFDITAPANNHIGSQSSPLRAHGSPSAGEISPKTFTRDMKRRKIIHSRSSSPESVGNDKFLPTDQSLNGDGDITTQERRTYAPPCRSLAFENWDGVTRVESGQSKASSRRIERLGDRGILGELVGLSLSNRSTIGRRQLTYPTPDWQDETSGFSSFPEDIHYCTSIESSARIIPFCVASCSTNSLVAVGDEEGQVRLLESTKEGKPAFKTVFLAFRPHSNAIIDLSFSLDDSLLATASGDQTARVVDMVTQTTVSVLAEHSASLKQVKFQPGVANNSVLATSSRDGSIQIWDLRCTGAQGPVQYVHVPEDSAARAALHPETRHLSYEYPINSLYGAHRPSAPGRISQRLVSRDGPTRGEKPGRIGDVSVTAISFLPHGQQHLLLSASEANATIKLWDIRSLPGTRGKTSHPVSFTAQPKSHNQWRSFGINSLCLNGDGTRLYALCRDSTIYAYSTAHLTLGQAPDLAGEGIWRRRKGINVGDVQEGLGPLYGFRHKQLHATSFYVKSAIRPPRNGKSEMLAVGSCDGCAVLFPTDEKYLDIGQTSDELGSKINPDDLFQPKRQPESKPGGLLRLDENLRISANGTPLIRGHDREVGSLSWTSEGDLITVGDDFFIRCWREGRKSSGLRVGGNQGSQTWRCGWANVPAVYDDDDE